MQYSFAYQIIVIAAGEEQYNAVSDRDCKSFLFGLSYKQKNQIKSREKMNQGLRSKDKGARKKEKG